MMASLLAIFFCGLFSCVYSIHFPPTRSLAIRMSADPFRPSRPPLAPILINAIQDLLMLEQPTIDDARGVVRKTIVSRNVDPDYNMTAAEEKLVEGRMFAIAAAVGELSDLLEQVVESTPWIVKYGALADFGIGQLSDPYVRMCRAECLLAILMLHVEARPDGEVDFIDEDRLGPLRNAAPVAREKCTMAVRSCEDVPTYFESP
mmetsp:Transcript_21223/g.41404  ORF Transcript_21223/g.41404 Transcript_21223/m.41404 type:complete len:204 (+) Transcript_21223:452-1063(+)